MRTLLVLFTSLLFLLATTGCTVLKKPKRTKHGREESVQTQLLMAAESIEKSLNILASAEKAKSPPVLETTPLKSPEGGMGGFVDMEWSGPIGPLVEKIADLTGYRAKILGKEPAIPVLVSIHAEKTPIADVLQNASLQAGKRALIMVFPHDRAIEVRYLQ